MFVVYERNDTFTIVTKPNLTLIDATLLYLTHPEISQQIMEFKPLSALAVESGKTFIGEFLLEKAIRPIKITYAKLADCKSILVGGVVSPKKVQWDMINKLLPIKLFLPLDTPYRYEIIYTQQQNVWKDLQAKLWKDLSSKDKVKIWVPFDLTPYQKFWIGYGTILLNEDIV